MTYSQTPVLRLLTDACPPWCPGHGEDFQPWHDGTGQLLRERDHATYFDCDPIEAVTVGVIAVQTITGIGPGLVVVSPEYGPGEDRQLTPGRAMALATALAVDGQAPGVVRQLRQAAAMARGWLN